MSEGRKMTEATKSAQEAFKTSGKASAQNQDVSAGARTTGREAERASMGGRVGGVSARSARDDSYQSDSYGLSRTWEQAMNYSRENPGKSTLIVFGVGLGVGLIMANGFTTRSRSQRMAPPLLNALSDIASALFR